MDSFCNRVAVMSKLEDMDEHRDKADPFMRSQPGASI